MGSTWDPSGNYGGRKARAIGAKSQAATSILKQEWNEDLDLDGALKLALKVLSKTMDSTLCRPTSSTLRRSRTRPSAAFSSSCSARRRCKPSSTTQNWKPKNSNNNKANK